MTAVLLDTHPLLWALGGDPRLPDVLGERLDADPSRFLVSDVSLWEIAVKRSTGKLDVPDDLPRILDGLGFGAAPLLRRQAWTGRGLPFHHRDPFDRLLIAQAQDLDVPVVTADAAFAAYDVVVDWPAR
ncbi:type II toxin-antitoxin system VapC family toxin [Patulibacter sp. S7RM1-6]